MTLVEFLRVAEKAADKSVTVPKELLKEIAAALNEGKRTALLCVTLKVALAMHRGGKVVEEIENEVNRVLEKEKS